MKTIPTELDRLVFTSFVMSSGDPVKPVEIELPLERCELACNGSNKYELLVSVTIIMRSGSGGLTYSDENSYRRTEVEKAKAIKKRGQIHFRQARYLWRIREPRNYLQR